MSAKEKAIKEAVEAVAGVADEAAAGAAQAAQKLSVKQQIQNLADAMEKNKQAFIEQGVGGLGIKLSPLARLKLAGDMKMIESMRFMHSFINKETGNLDGMGILKYYGKELAIGAGSGAAIGGIYGAISDDTSVWEGMKSGALWGMGIFTKYGMLKASSGATTYNPFSPNGPIRRTWAMWSLTGSNAKRGSTYAKIIGQQQMSDLTEDLLGLYGKGSSSSLIENLKNLYGPNV